MCSEEEIMVDIDSFLEGELASINEVLEQFSAEDKKAEKRNQDEMKLLESKDATVSEGKGLGLGGRRASERDGKIPATGHESWANSHNIIVYNMKSCSCSYNCEHSPDY